MKNLKLLLGLTVFVTIILGVFSSCTNANAERKTPIKENSTTINWLSIEQLEATQPVNSKKIIIDVYTDWCKWCKVMDQKTFSDSDLIDYLNKDYHMVKLNAEDKSHIKFNGKNYSYVKNGRRGYNELAYELCQGRLSYPSFVVLDERFEVINVIPGFRDPDQFKAALNTGI